jgi:hypothetical protein
MRPTPEQYRRGLLAPAGKILDETLAKGRQAGVVDPWLVLCDLSDHHGRQFAIYAEAALRGDGAERRVDEQARRSKDPLTTVAGLSVPGALMPQLLAYTSPTAAQSIEAILAHRAANPGTVPVVVIGMGGNTYSLRGGDQ